MSNNTETIYLSNASKEVETQNDNETGTSQFNLDNIEEFTNVCRMCAAVTEFIVPIFIGEGLQNKLAEKINKYLPIEVSEEDMLPQVICYQCVSTLISWHDLVQNCSQANAALKTKLDELLANEDSVLYKKKYETRTKGKLETELSVSSVRDIIIKIFQIADPDLMNSGLEFLCEKCDKQFSTLDSFVEHLQSEHCTELKNITIKKYIKEYVSIVEALIEDSTHEEPDIQLNLVKLERYNCPFCKSSFSSPSRLINHLNQHTEIRIEEGVDCCDKLYYNTKPFVKHLQGVHVKRAAKREEANTCRSCGFIANNKDQLKDHITELHVIDVVQNKDMIHHNKWQKYIPAVCPECNKTFSNKYNMLIHMKTHEDREMYPCDRCSKIYKSKASLKSHQDISHKGILSFVCSHCGEAFPSRLARDVHDRIHTGDKPYTCEYCDRSYRAKNTLDRHLEIHFNVRNYECYICSKRFRKNTHLKYHLTTHKRRL